MDFIYKVIESILMHRLNKSIDNCIENEQPKNEIIEPISPSHINSGDEIELPSTTKRLQIIVDLLFRNKYQKHYLNEVADTLGFINETEFYKLLNGETEPSFAFLDSFSEKYGVNKSWLKSGKGSPFIVTVNELCLADYFNFIKDIKPKRIFLIREDSDDGRAGVVLKLDNWNYKILGKNYKISSKVGAIGQIRIREFYYLLKNLNYSGLDSSTNSVILSTELFGKIFSGNISPSILEVNNYEDIKYSDWADDFLDFNHKYAMANDYGMMYGTEFTEAQNILKYMIKEQHAPTSL